MDFSVVSGSVGLWKPLPHLLWTDRTGIGRFWVRLTILLLRTGRLNTLSDSKCNSSRISEILYSSLSTVFIMPQHNSHSVLTTLFPDGSIRGIQGSYPLALITHTMQRQSIFDMFL